MRYFIPILLYILFPTEAFASAWEVPATDKSLQYLGVIFGGKVGTIQLGSGQDFNPVLAQMFNIFNMIVVSVGAALVSWIGIVSTINTANEGTALGRKYATFWLPARALIGMLIMVPTPGTGYSIMQTSVMWFILQGIAAANQIWNVVLDNLAQGIGAAGQTDTANILNKMQDFDTWAPKVLNSLVCANFLNENPNIESQIVADLGRIRRRTVPVATTGSGNSFTAGVDIQFRPGTSSVDYCGTIQVRATSSTAAKAESLLGYKLDGVAAVINSFNSSANRIAAQDEDSMPPTTVQQAKQGYANSLATYFAQQNASQGSQNQSEEYENAKLAGWVHAGSYYFALGRSVAVQVGNDGSAIGGPSIIHSPTSGNLEQIVNLDPGTTETNNFLTEELKEKLRKAKKAFDDNKDTTNQPKLELPGGSALSGTGLDAVMQPYKNSVAGTTQNFINMVSGDNDVDPIVQMAKFGGTLMFAAEMAWIVMVVGSSIVMIIAAVMSACQPGAYVFSTLILGIIGVLVGVLMSMWGIGATLSYYIPFIPYIIFTTSAVGWMIAVIEAIVAAPIFALAVMHPSGEELGQVKSGLMILINIFLRPSLMIFGFIFAAKLLRAAIRYLNYGFSETVANVQGGLMFSFFAWILPFILYMGLVMAITNKCFSLIHYLPDQILRWIGGGPEQVGSSAAQTAQEAKQSYDRGAQEVGQIQGATGKVASSGAAEMSKGAKARAEQKGRSGLNKGRAGGGDMPGAS